MVNKNQDLQKIIAAMKEASNIAENEGYNVLKNEIIALPLIIERIIEIEVERRDQRIEKMQDLIDDLADQRDNLEYQLSSYFDRE